MDQKPRPIQAGKLVLLVTFIDIQLGTGGNDPGLGEVILAESCNVSFCIRVLSFHISPCKAISRK